MVEEYVERVRFQVHFVTGQKVLKKNEVGGISNRRGWGDD